MAAELGQYETSSSKPVAGLVLVDALEENVRQEMKQLSPNLSDSLDSQVEIAKMLWYASYIGLMRLLYLIQRPLREKRFHKSSIQYVNMFSPSSAHRRGIYEEAKCVEESEAMIRETDSSVVPPLTVILTHGKSDMFSEMIQSDPSILPDERELLIQSVESKWLEGQRRLAYKYANMDAEKRNKENNPLLLVSQVSKVVHKVLADTMGHWIPQEEPEQVIAAVLAIINENDHKSSTAGLVSLVNDECQV